MSSQNVKIENATKVYGDFKACDHISLDIKGGEFFYSSWSIGMWKNDSSAYDCRI